MIRPISPAATPAADPARAIPASAGERRFAIDGALATLAAEERRLARLGFEVPLARCHEQRRFWEFVSALHTVAERATERRVA